MILRDMFSETTKLPSGKSFQLCNAQGLCRDLILPAPNWTYNTYNFNIQSPDHQVYRLYSSLFAMWCFNEILINV